MKMKAYYRNQMVALGMRTLIGIGAGAIILPIVCMVAGSAGEALAGIVAGAFLGYMISCIPTGWRMAGRADGLLSGFIILPLVGWLILVIVKLMIIIYGGMIGTPVLLISYALRSAAARS